MSKKPRFRRFAFQVHKWAGLVGGAWLFVLGATGIVLDHDEWRWARQITVPQSWISPNVGRLLPATRMRHVAVDESDPQRWLGGSERGLWRTDDGGGLWEPVPFDGLVGETPQVQGFVRPSKPGLDGVWLGTDDGLWRSTEDGKRAERVGLAGQFITDLTAGSAPDELVGVVDHDRIFRINVGRPEDVTWVELSKVAVTGLPEHISLYRFFFDLHFGYGLFSRNISTLINDYGGLSFMILAVSGFLFWWFPKRWKRARRPTSPQKKKATFNWLYRAHAPIIGILALIPIGYLSLTAIPMVHVVGFGEWADDVLLPRSSLPPVYQFRSLRGEVDHIVAYPGDPGRLTIGTRLGVLNSEDGGASWYREEALPAASGNLFRVGAATFFSNNARKHYVRTLDDDALWKPVEGIASAMTDGVQLGNQWVMKNSRGFNFGDLAQGFSVSDNVLMPELPGATLYLFLVDIHVGLVFHRQFKMGQRRGERPGFIARGDGAGGSGGALNGVEHARKCERGPQNAILGIESPIRTV